MRHTVKVGGGEPIEIEIVGTDDEGEPIEPILFNCVRKMQAKRFTSAFAALESRSMESTDEILNFITKAIKKDERQRFTDITESEDIVLELDDLADIVVYLVKAYGDRERPTEPSVVSSNGQTTATATSTVPASGIPDPIPENSISPTSAMSSTP